LLPSCFARLQSQTSHRDEEPKHQRPVGGVETDVDSFNTVTLASSTSILNFTDLGQLSFGMRIAYPLSEEKHHAEQFCHGVLIATTMSCLTRNSTSTTYENRDKRFRANGKTTIARTLHIIFVLWLVASVALILTAISQRRAIIELLKTASAPSTSAALTFPAQPSNPWTYGAQSLACDLPFPDTRREAAC
jgi:hypothetical protein